ncbi:MAG: hypothetical protein AAGF30_16760 [Pseudomonadota bacterium]
MRTLIVSIVLAVLFATPALAQTPNCGPRPAVVEALSGSYAETFSGGGIQNDEAVFEVWVSPETGTWTILRTNAAGISCIMAAGTGWFSGASGAHVAGVPS